MEDEKAIVFYKFWYKIPEFQWIKPYIGIRVSNEF